VSLQERIAADLADAQRARDKDRVRVLRLLRAALQNAAIDAGGVLDEDAVQRVLRRQAKQRRDSVSAYEAGGRDDLAAMEKAELAVIGECLPQQIDDTALEAAARSAIEAVGASGPGDLGKVMGPLMKDLGGQADGRRANAMVRRLLAESVT